MSWIEDPFQSNCQFEGDSLRSAKDWLGARFESGELVPCPCCGQGVKKYARPIYASMISALRFIAKNPGASSKQVVRATGASGGGDHAKLVHWALLEQRKGGGWYCTERGRSFLRGELRVTRYVYIYNSRYLGASFQDLISIRDIMGDEFSFDELMDPSKVAA